MREEVHWISRGRITSHRKKDLFAVLEKTIRGYKKMKITVKDMLDKLDEFDAWEDGESLSDIRARLTPEQLASEFTYCTYAKHRAGLPSILRVNATLLNSDETILFEVQHKLPADMPDDSSLNARFEDMCRKGYIKRKTKSEW